MFKRTLLLALLLTACLAFFLAEGGSAQTPGAFYGYIYYHGEICHCVYIPPHIVQIVKDGGNPEGHRVHCGTNPGYATLGYSYTAGWYTFSVNLPPETGCNMCTPRRVYYNGVGEMRVDLNVYGDNGTPTNPEEGP